MPVNRRTLWLGFALAVVVVAAISVRSNMNATTPASPRPAPPGGGPSSTAAAAQLGAADVNLEALTRERGEPSNGGRNPFRFQPKAPPPAAPFRPPSEETRGSPPPVRPAGPPPPPPIPLKFIGLVEKADGTRIAVLSDGRRPISGQEGQEIDGRYRILKIGNESIEVAYLDGRGRQTIKLTGQ